MSMLRLNQIDFVVRVFAFNISMRSVCLRFGMMAYPPVTGGLMFGICAPQLWPSGSHLLRRNLPAFPDLVRSDLVLCMLFLLNAVPDVVARCLRADGGL